MNTRFKDAMSKLWRLRLLRAIGIALIAYALIGFLIAPPIVKWQLNRTLSSVTGREVNVEKVRINPFALSVRLQGFRMREAQGNDNAATFEELYVNLSTVSLFRLAPVLDEIRLTRPAVRIVRLNDKRYNFQDIIERLTAKPAEPSPQAESGQPPRFSLNNIELVDGRVDFDDRPAGKKHVVSAIRLGIPFISSLPYAAELKVEPYFSTQVNGTPLELKGTTKPFNDTRETSFRIALESLDLTRYIDYSPVPLDVRLTRGTLSTRLTLALTTRANQLDTLALSGDVGLRDLDLADTSGQAIASLASLDANARIALTHRDKKQSLNVSDAATTLRGLRVADGNTREALAEIGEIAVNQVRASLDTHDLQIGLLAIRAPRVHVARARDGSFNFDDLTQRFGNAPAPEAAKPATPWIVTLGQFRLEDGALTYDDATPATPFRSTLSEVALAADNLSTARDTTSTLRLDAVVNKRGTLHTEGTATITPLNAALDVAIKDIALLPFQPYVSEQMNVELTQGVVQSRARVYLAAPEDKPVQVRFGGDIGVRGFAARDTRTDQELLRWKRLDLKGVDASTEPLKVHVREIVLRDFYSRLIVDADGVLNVQTLMRDAPPTVAEAASPGPAAEQVPPAAATGNLRVGRIVVSGGTVNFSDYHIRPNVSANLAELSGSVTEMTPETPGEVELNGKVAGDAPLTVKGRINPLAADLFADIEANASEIELPQLSPYSIKYAGYGIEKGKLSMRLKYLIDQRKLEATNGIYLDQLTFGEHVDSPTATKLPVLLAVSLLKDRNGVIDVNLPISGSLDDPEFRVGRIILKVLGNLIAKAATSPFALLGAAFGGGEELSAVDFNAGHASLTPAAEQKLATLAKALADRPALRMEIAGRANPDTDPDAWRRAQIEDKIRTQKLKSLGDAAASSAETVTIAPDERTRYLTAAYKAEKFSKPRNFIGIAKSLPPEEMERLMFENIRVTDDDLRALANRRAQAVKEWLAGPGGIATERLFLTAPQLGDTGLKDGAHAAPRAEFTLK